MKGYAHRKIIGVTLVWFGLVLSIAAADREPKVRTISEYKSEQSFKAPAAEWPCERWWTKYGDTQLDALVEEAIGNSPSMAVAQARLLQATGQTQTSRSTLLPTVTGNVSVTEQKESYNGLIPSQYAPHGMNAYSNAEADFSWELDFWGKNRAALAASLSAQEAARADVEQARTVLIGSVASSYAELARLYATRANAQATLDVRNKTAALLRLRYESGMETLVAVKQAESRAAAAEKDLATTDEQLNLQRNRLAILVGAGPDRGLAIKPPEISLQTAYGLPAELPANLLGRRPDIVAARLRVQAAAKKIAVQRAAFYPNVNLTGFLGYDALGLGKLLDINSSIAGIKPAISLPIFNRGQLKGHLRSARGDYAEAVASYDQSVLHALQEVADAATSLKAQQTELAKAQESTNAAHEAFNMVKMRYEGGLSNYIEVLSAEDTWLASVRDLTDSKARNLGLDISLAQALGGGYE